MPNAWGVTRSTIRRLPPRRISVHPEALTFVKLHNLVTKLALAPAQAARRRGRESLIGFALELLKAHLSQCRAGDSAQRVHDVLRRVTQ
jgi:hypothetical protein